MKKQYAYLFLTLANLFWASNYVLGKFIVVELSPLFLTYSRWLLALFLLLPLAFIMEKPKWKEILKQWKVIIVMSVFGVIGYNSLLYEALKYTSSMNAALINAMNPLVIVIMAYLFLKEEITKWSILGMTISSFGVLLVLFDGDLFEFFRLTFNRGDLLVMLAIIIWGYYSIVTRKLKDLPPIATLTVCAAIAVLIMTPFALFVDLDYTLNNYLIIAILFTAIFPTVGGFLFWNIGLYHVDANQAGVFLNLGVVFTAIISLIIGEVITVPQIIGSLFVFVGLYFTTKKKKTVVAESFNQIDR